MFGLKFLWYWFKKLDTIKNHFRFFMLCLFMLIFLLNFRWRAWRWNSGWSRRGGDRRWFEYLWIRVFWRTYYWGLLRACYRWIRTCGMCWATDLWWRGLSICWGFFRRTWFGLRSMSTRLWGMRYLALLKLTLELFLINL